MQGNTREINEREAKREANDPWPIGNEAGITLGEYERLHEAKREAMLQEAMAKSRKAEREANEANEANEAVRSFVKKYHTSEREANEANEANEAVRSFVKKYHTSEREANEANEANEAEREAGSGVWQLIERQELSRNIAFQEALDLAIDEAVAASRLALRDMLEVSVEDLLFKAVNEALQND